MRAHTRDFSHELASFATSQRIGKLVCRGGLAVQYYSNMLETRKAIQTTICTSNGAYECCESRKNWIDGARLNPKH